MDKQLEQKVKDLEQRVVALEEQVQAQPEKILLTLDGKTIVQTVANYGISPVIEE